MSKVLTFLKSNIVFFVIVAISLVFYLIAILGGDYQTTTFFGEVTHKQFLTGLTDGVKLAFVYVVAPAVCLLLIIVLNFFKPKKREGAIATVFVSLFIGISTIAGALLVLIPFALFKDANIVYYQIVDWKSLSEDVYYIKTFNFPLLSMTLSLTSIVILGCYTSARLSE